MNFHEIAQRSKASQDKWELEHLLLEVDKIKPKVILEIGVHMGHGMRHLKEAFDPSFLLGLERDTCYEYPNLHVMKGIDSHDISTFLEVKKRLNDREVDFMFIDGDHSYEGVKKDFEMYSPLVRKGGIVAFHDARLDNNDTCFVFQYWKEIKEQFPHKEIFNPSGDIGTGVGVIYL